MNDNPLRRLPSVAKILQLGPVAALNGRASHTLIVEAARAELDRLRHTSADNPATITNEAIGEAVRRRVEAALLPGYRPVINATGIVLHTNLGRAPLAESAARAAYNAARGYLPLEFDLATGERADRLAPVRSLICRLTGAEAATAVNNCAAATLITLRVLAAGREVIVSRGQLIEIGGSFRLPEIMAASGATLREVGTTNKTRLRDYERAIGPNTAAILRVHCSNYRIRGFTESVDVAELVTLGRTHNVPVIDDVGSGATAELFDEPTIQAGIAAGADLVLFSGDKLLGGPQAGIIAGRKHWIDAIERDPFMRAMRLDKMTLAALEATLRLHRDEAAAQRVVPTLAMLHAQHDRLRERCHDFQSRLRSAGLDCELHDDVCYAGGGTLPDHALPTVVIAAKASGASEAAFAARLRIGEPPVVARIRQGAVLFDLRTVPPEQESDLLAAILAAAR